MLIERVHMQIGHLNLEIVPFLLFRQAYTLALPLHMLTYVMFDKTSRRLAIMMLMISTIMILISLKTSSSRSVLRSLLLSMIQATSNWNRSQRLFSTIH